MYRMQRVKLLVALIKSIYRIRAMRYTRTGPGVEIYRVDEQWWVDVIKSFHFVISYGFNELTFWMRCMVCGPRNLWME